MEDDNDGRTITEDLVKKHYMGACNILKHLSDYEKLVPGFETERKKANILKLVEIAVTSGLVPELYLDCIFHMAIGILWIKFTPCHDPAMSLLQQLFVSYKSLRGKYMSRFLVYYDHMGMFCQLANDSSDNPNSQLDTLIFQSINFNRIRPDNSSDLTSNKVDIFSDIYLEEVTGKQEYMILKDFHFLLCKTLFPIVDFIFNSQELRKQLFSGYANFYAQEYTFLSKGTSKKDVEMARTNEGVKEQMMRSNIVDSEDFKSKRRISYGKLCSYTELFSKSSSLNKLSPE
jgi:hypothetical protein